MNILKQLWEPGMRRTILFSLAVVSFVIGTYQTVVQNNETALRDNYWLFMISFVCVLLFRYLKPQEQSSGASKASAKQPNQPVKQVPRNKRRG